MSFADNAPSWEVLADMVRAKREELGVQEPNLEEVGTKGVGGGVVDDVWLVHDMVLVSNSVYVCKGCLENDDVCMQSIIDIPYTSAQ